MLSNRVQVRSRADHGLPVARTSFIGRARELGTLERLLRTSRFVTLTGPGGTGKTRVALEAATAYADRFPDGVIFVDLAPVADATLVPATIAQSVGIADDGRRTTLEAVQGALRFRQTLLLLDNFEHV